MERKRRETEGRKKKRGRKMKKGEKEGGATKGMKMCFWNIAELTSKDKEVWEYLKTFDVIGLTEPEEDKWEKLKYRLPKEFDWKCRAARRVRKKGRAKGGIITGINKEVNEIEYKEISDNMVERK